jgi:hypothetical protein
LIPKALVPINQVVHRNPCKHAGLLVLSLPQFGRLMLEPEFDAKGCRRVTHKLGFIVMRDGNGTQLPTSSNKITPSNSPS